MESSVTQTPCIRVLGVRVDMVQIPDVVRQMVQWIEHKDDRCHHVINTGMHGIMVAHKDPEFKNILNSSDLFFPDGISVIIIARLRGHRLHKKGTGPELLREFCKVASAEGYSSYFYGDTDETLQRLTGNFQKEFPSIKIAGAYSPPFRQLTREEDDEIVDRITLQAPTSYGWALVAPSRNAGSSSTKTA